MGGGHTLVVLALISSCHHHNAPYPVPQSAVPLRQALKGVASKHNVSISAVAIKWALQQPMVQAAVVGARNARHVTDLRQMRVVSCLGKVVER